MTNPIIDVVIPCYAETEEAIISTINACLAQSLKPNKIIIYDDGSPIPLTIPENMITSGQSILIRCDQNYGISTARNRGFSHTQAEYIIFLNCEVLPSSDWFEKATNILKTNPQIGIVGGKIVPTNMSPLMLAWRMRFLENPEEQGIISKEINFATAHCTMIRRRAFDVVKGYDERFQRTHEDHDICVRLRNHGFSTFFDPELTSISIETASIDLFSKKIIRHSGWSLDRNLKNDFILKPVRLFPCLHSANKSFYQRLGRNIFKFRLSLIPIDIFVWLWSVVLIFRNCTKVVR